MSNGNSGEIWKWFSDEISKRILKGIYEQSKVELGISERILEIAP